MFDKFRKIFFENINLKQTIFKNTFWLALAEVISGFLRLILVIYVARILGALEYGKFTFAFSFVSLMVIFSDLGVIDIITREFSRDKEKEKYFPAVLGLEVFLDTITLILMVAGSFFITSDPSIRRIIWILSVFILISSSSQVFYSFLRSRQKMEYEAGVKIIQAMVMVGLSFLFVFYVPSAFALSYGYLISNILVLIIFLSFFHFFFQRLKLSWDVKIWRKILKISWPLSLGFMAGWIYITISSIILGYLGMITENGWYNAASKIAYSAIIPASLIVKSFYPALSNFFITSREKLQKSWDYLMESIIFLTAPMVAGGIVLAPKIINFFYGHDFAPSILAFQLLVIVVGIIFINYPYSTILVVVGHQNKNFILIMVGAVIDTILNFIFIYRYGFYGAIVAAIIASIIIFLSTVIISKIFAPISIFDKKILKSLIIAAFSVLIMVFIIRQPAVYNLNVFIAVVIGGIIYSIVYFPLWLFLKKKKIKFI